LPDGALAFCASAESSPNAYDDGVVTGSALGILGADSARLCPLLDEHSAPVRDKVEGLALFRSTPASTTRGSAQHAYLVFDPDDHHAPATLAEVELLGF
jgi:hypothetical protein